MKRMKRIASLIMALAMALTLAVPVMAATNEKGTITVNGASSGNTYTIYKMLELESYNTTAGTYAYKVVAGWEDFFETDDAKAYFNVDSQGYATWVHSATTGTPVAEFAKLAMAYAEENEIPNQGTQTPTVDDSTLFFDDLELGYYLVDSTMGALCGLTTTNPNANITAKNDAPSIDKQVKEDSTGNWGPSNSAEIGQDVEFRTTISVHAGAQNYVLHDKMDAALTFKKVDNIEHDQNATGKKTPVPTDYYTVKTENLGDECTFHVEFTNDFCDHLADNDSVVIYYTATVNENAVMSPEVNRNESWLDFGENHESNHDTTDTYVYSFDLVKVDGQRKLLDGAAFRLYDAKTEGNEIPVVKVDDYNYRRAEADEVGVDIVVTDGKVRVSGFDLDTFYLEEVATPAGYNQLSERQQIRVSTSNMFAQVDDNKIVSAGSGVIVVNQSGSMLPATGGMGTTLFYLAGGLLVIGAGVALVTKKRMA